MTSTDSSKKPVKVDKWDGVAVKNALDDGARKVFTEDLDFVEQFHLCDMRLAMCTVAVLIALYALLWDWLYPFPASTSVLAKCAASYFFVTMVATLYIQFVERGIFFVGYNRDLSMKIEGCNAVLFNASVSSAQKNESFTLTVQMKAKLEGCPTSDK